MKRLFTILLFTTVALSALSAQKERPDVPLDYTARWYIPVLSVLNPVAPSTGFGYEWRKGAEGWGVEAWYLLQQNLNTVETNNASHGYRIRGLYRYYFKSYGAYSDYWVAKVSWQQRFNNLDGWYRMGDHLEYFTGNDMTSAMRFNVGYGFIHTFRKSHLVSDMSMSLGLRLINYHTYGSAEAVSQKSFFAEWWYDSNRKWQPMIDITFNYSLGRRIVAK